MVLDGAYTIAKKAQREVVEADIVSAAKALISRTEKTIEDLQAKGITDIAKYQTEIAGYREFAPAPVFKSSAETFTMLVPILNSLPGDIDRNPKSTGRVIGIVKNNLGAEEFARYDMKLVSSYIKKFLTPDADWAIRD